MIISRIRGALLLATTFALTACGAGSGASSPIPQVAPSQPASKPNIQSFAFSVPTTGRKFTASGLRQAAYISAATTTVSVKLTYGTYASPSNPIAYSHTFTIASDCPVAPGGTHAICTVGLSSLTPPPAGYVTGDFSPISATATAFDSHGAIVSNIENAAFCEDPFHSSAHFAQITTCSLPLSGIVSFEAVVQAKPLVAGTPQNIALTPIFTDPDSFVLSDDAVTNVNSCFLTTNSDPFHQTMTFNDPHITLSTNHPYFGLTQYHLQYAGCSGGTGAAVSNTLLAGPQPANYLGVNALLSPSDVVSLAYDGTLEAANPLTFKATIVPIMAAASAGPTLTYTPIIVPKTYVTIPNVATPQVLTVPVPAGFAGSVSLAVSNCLRAAVVVAYPGSSTGGAPTSNVTAAPLVSVSPASVVPSSPGSPVSFTITSLSNAGTGACILTSSADASVFGAVVAW